MIKTKEIDHKSMFYRDLKIGDIFSIDRENNDTFYVKKDTYIQVLGKSIFYRRLKGDVRVRYEGKEVEIK